MALPPNNNYLYGNINLPNNNNQIAFNPNTLYDSKIKNMYEMEKMGYPQPNLKNMKERDVDQFNKGKGPLSLPADEYKGIEGYTANATGYPGASMTDANLYSTGTTNNTSTQNNLMNYDEHYEMLPEENTGGLIDYLKTQGSKFKDFAMPAVKNVAGRTIASQVLGKAGNMMFGVPGALAGMIFGGLKGGNMFNQPYIGGHNTIDQYGNLISGEELDKQNALGGYYTDAARASRRRDKSIRNMIARRDAGLNYGENRLEDLLKLQGKEETSRQDAFNQAMDQGQGFYDNLNDGAGASVSQSSRESAGSGYSRSDDSWDASPFAKGGVVGLYR